jgi:DNA-binding MarR family transcriptional regulator
MMDTERRYDLDDSIPYVLYRITNKLNQDIHERLRSSGMTLSKWRLLSSLKSRRMCSVGELAMCTVMQHPVVSRILTEMENEKLVKRQPSSTDQRLVQVKLTRKGEQSFQQAFEIAEKHRQRALQGLSPDQTETLLSLLRTIQGNIGIAPEVA